MEASLPAVHARLMNRPSLEELQQYLRHPGVVILLVLILLLYFPYAGVFYFAKSCIGSVGPGDPEATGETSG